MKIFLDIVEFCKTLRGMMFRVVIPFGVPRDSAWPSLRKLHLRDYPTCACCGSKNKLQVHHMLPYHLHPMLELDPRNLMTLCDDPKSRCHFIFGHLRNYRSYNPTVKSDVAIWFDKVYNRP